MNYTIKLKSFPEAEERKAEVHGSGTSKDMPHQEINHSCKNWRTEKLLWTQLLTAEEHVGCEAYGQPGFSSLLGEKHILDFSEVSVNDCVKGRMTASNQPCIRACGMPRRGALHRSKEECSIWIPNECCDLVLPLHKFLMRSYIEGYFSSSHFGGMKSSKKSEANRILTILSHEIGRKVCCVQHQWWLRFSVAAVSICSYLSTRNLGSGLGGQWQE